MNTDRLPMSAPECEQDLIGCALAVIQDPANWQECLDRVKGRHFQDEGLGHLWDALVSMRQAGKPMSTEIVGSELVRRGFGADLKQIVADLSMRMFATRDMPHYAEQVIETWRMRQLQRIAESIHAAAVGGIEGGADAIVSKAVRAIERVSVEGGADTITTLGDGMREVVDSSRAGNAVARIKTGMPRFDELFAGIPTGFFTLVGGRPGMGKSQFVKQVLLNAASSGIPSGLVTVEENVRKVSENMLANLTGIANNRIALNRLDASDMITLDEWATAKAGLPFYIEDTQFALTGICRSIRRMALRNKTQIIGVDYIQIIDSEQRTDNENRIITVLSQTLKRLARELNVALIVAAQLNRSSAHDARRPKLTDLRGSGSLEQDGDLIILLHRDDYYHEGEIGFIPSGLVEVNVAKNKHGRRQMVELNWSGDRQQIF